MLAPTIPLRTGAQLPMVGLGTFGSDRFSNADIAAAVKEAIGLGFRHIDCAACYGNEKEVGAAIREALQDNGLRREELFITSKVWNDRHGDVRNACLESLRDLGLDYLDLYLVHWPLPNYHAPHADPDARNPDAVPYRHEDYMACWRQMEALVDEGLVRAIGTSNMTVKKLQGVLRDCRIPPACNEMELHPHFQQPALLQYCQSQGVVPIAFCPIGSPNRPARDVFPGDTVDIQDPVVVRIAQAHGVHPALVCIKWAAQRGAAPIPFSVKPPQIESNLRAVCEAPLTDAEMAALAEIDHNCRLIKGQVFLWPGAEDWKEIWED